MNQFTESAVHPLPKEPEAHHLSVSVVIPCYNEERFIGSVLERLAPQYDADRYEIIVVDGESTDQTRDVVEKFADEHPSIGLIIVSNPKRNIPTALNLGIDAARGEVIVRMDAHSVPSKNYVKRCVEVLSEENISVVGMPWRIQPADPSSVSRAIAQAVSHPFGIGDAKYRLKVSEPQFVDTVPFGAFHKSLWTRLGGFNERLLTNEDYDFNYRVRKDGGRILLDTSAYSDYFARPTLRSLAAQYWRYGLWKAQMVKLHPASIKLRQIVAPLFVMYSIFSIAVAALVPLGWLFLLPLVMYAAFAFVFALQLAVRASDWKLAPLIFLTFPLMHFSWGIGFLAGLIRGHEG